MQGKRETSSKTSWKRKLKQESVEDTFLFYDIGNFVPYIIKTLRGDAHSREEEVCRKRLRSARECARAHSFIFAYKELRK